MAWTAARSSARCASSAALLLSPSRRDCILPSSSPFLNAMVQTAAAATATRVFRWKGVTISPNARPSSRKNDIFRIADMGKPSLDSELLVGHMGAGAVQHGAPPCHLRGRQGEYLHLYSGEVARWPRGLGLAGNR